MALTGWGSFAEQVKVPAYNVMPIPEGMDFASAAAFGHDLRHLDARPETACQPATRRDPCWCSVASGGVGLAAVEIGKAMGARVIAAASTPDKLAVAKAAGADELVNYSEGSLREQLKALTGGQGVDVIYDPVGGELFEEAFRSIAWNGRMLVVGFASGSIPSLPANLPLLKGASLVGVFWGSFAQRQPQDNADNFRQLFAWHAEGRLKPLVSQRFPLERAGDAIDALGQRKAVGKVVVEVR
ncbi:putative oxidoreductase [Pseudomonas aeruginosa]|nr:putative oxidoreductase [Pseudomonas aeruginosa]